MAEPIKSSQGALWIQTTPGKAAEYVGCLDLDPIAEPAGDVGLLICRDVNGKYKTAGRTQGVPGPVTTSLSAWLYPDANILDRIRNCPVNLFALSRDCGLANVFSNYVRGTIVGNALVSNRSLENIVMREADDPALLKLDFSGDNPTSKLRQVKVTQQAIAEAQALNDISFCNAEECAGACGPQQDLGEDGVTISNANVGSPTNRADVWWTTDKGAAWQHTLGGAADPFPAAQDLLSVVCFQIDRNTTRWLIAREPVVANPAKIAYSDNGGASWTVVTVGSTNNEGAAWNGALFSLDSQHIWFCTSVGNVYFSADGGLTWTDQDALLASGSNSLNCIKFCDSENGYAVGDNDTIIHSVDGGDTWSDVASPTVADDLLSLHVFTRFRFTFGDDAGEIYQSWDEGGNFEAKAYTGQAATDNINDMMFVNDLVGYMVQNTSAPVGHVHRSKDGGHSWERLDNPGVNAGLNAIWACDENLAYAVGSPSGGTAVVYKVSG